MNFIFLVVFQNLKLCLDLQFLFQSKPLSLSTDKRGRLFIRLLWLIGLQVGIEIPKTDILHQMPAVHVLSKAVPVGHAGAALRA